MIWQKGSGQVFTTLPASILYMRNKGQLGVICFFKIFKPI
jgi:hypothetical protein